MLNKLLHIQISLYKTGIPEITVSCIPRPISPQLRRKLLLMLIHFRKMIIKIIAHRTHGRIIRLSRGRTVIPWRLCRSTERSCRTIHCCILDLGYWFAPKTFGKRRLCWCVDGLWWFAVPFYEGPEDACEEDEA